MPLPPPLVKSSMWKALALAAAAAAVVEAAVEAEFLRLWYRILCLFTATLEIENKIEI
jgi:hypothetical protein